MIHVVGRDGEWEIWTDTEVETCDGRCVAVGTDFERVKAEALEELLRDFIKCARLKEPRQMTTHA